MHIFNKTFRVLRKKKPRESWGKRLWTVAKDGFPPSMEGKPGIQVGSDSLLLPKHVSKGILWIFLVSSFFVFSLFFLESNV